MTRCTVCRAELPLGARFCFECGAAVTTADSAASPGQPPANAVSEGRPAFSSGPGRDSVLNPEGTDFGEERFRKPPLPPGTVICRFCKGPLDLEGAFCEQCGAPVEEAAPPGLVKPKPAGASVSEPSPPIMAVPETAPPPPAEHVPAVAEPPESQMAVPAAPKATAGLSPPLKPPLAPLPAPPSPIAPPLVESPSPELSAPQTTPVVAPPQQQVASAATPRVPTEGSAQMPKATPEAATEKAPAIRLLPATVLSPSAPGPAASAADSKAVAPVPPLPGPPRVVGIPRRVSVFPPAWASGAWVKRPSPTLLWAIVGVIVLGMTGAAVWYSSKPHLAASPGQPQPQAAAPAAAPSNPLPAPQVEAPQKEAESVESPPSATPLVKRKKRPPKTVSAPPSPPANPKAQEIANLESQARDAYTKGDFAEPAGANAIVFLKQALALDPSDRYAKSLMENSVNGGKYKVQQALFRKDFTAARQMTEAMIQLLPDRRDVAGLREDIASTERADAAARQPKPAAPAVSFQAYHMHSEKSPAEDGPYCEGTLSVVSGHLKFTGGTASSGERTDNFDIPCADIRAIKKNTRVASHQSGFHVRTATANINFVPADSDPAHISALTDACLK